jgi:hypothetical protein
MHCTQMLFESKIHIKDKLFFAVISIATTLNVKKSLRPELHFVFFAYFNNENANARM